MDEQVDVVGHEDIGKDSESVLLGGFINAFSEGLTDSVV